jgi:hypothetical protein
MSYVPFESLPDSSRLWIFAADRALTDSETDMLLREMQAFCNSCLAHQQQMTGSCKMIYNQFLLTAADEATFPSGCSTDEMMRRVRMLGETYGVEFFGMPRVQYRDNGIVHSVNRVIFGEMVKKGDISANTTVFDNTLISLAEFRKGMWELPAINSWHARAFDFVK